MIQLFDIKTRTLGFAFCQPPKMSLPKSLTQKKSLQNFKPQKSPQIANFKPQKSPQIANFKPKKGLRTSPSLLYLSTPPGSVPHFPRQNCSRRTTSPRKSCQTLGKVALAARKCCRSMRSRECGFDKFHRKTVIALVLPYCLMDYN